MEKAQEKKRPHICKHAQLGRSCNICDLEEEVESLQRQLDTATQEIERKDEEIKSWVKRYNDNFSETLKIVKRRDQLQQELELKESEYQATIEKYHMASRLAREYQKENNRFRSALEWYADKENYVYPEAGDYKVADPEVLDDKGHRAHEALKGSP